MASWLSSVSLCTVVAVTYVGPLVVEVLSALSHDIGSPPCPIGVLAVLMRVGRRITRSPTSLWSWRRHPPFVVSAISVGRVG